MKLGFIGAGRMAEAVIRGLISSKAVQKKSVTVSDKDSARLKLITKKFGVSASDNINVAHKSDVIILAVKPQVMAQVLSQIGPGIQRGQLVISIAAGITLKSIEKYISKAAVVRVMPNNPALIGEGVTLICGGTRASEKDVKTAEKIFSAVGTTHRIEERHMNAVTGLSGSGPAFVYEFIDALTDGGIEAGLSKDLASELAVRTMLGSIKTVIKTKKSPEELKNMVASPGGTTLAGLRVMDEAGFKSILKKTVIRAAQRAKEISEEFDKSL